MTIKVTLVTPRNINSCSDRNEEKLILRKKKIHSQMALTKIPKSKTMVRTIPLKELRPELPDVINDIDRKLDRYIVTKRGRPVVVMMSVDDYEGLMETIDILSDKQAVKRIKKAKKE